jgi:hypothetical protein
MKKILATAIVTAFCTLLALPAAGASLRCNGTVAEVWYHAPGVVLVKLSSMNTAAMVCEINSDWLVPGSLSGATTPASCKAIYAALLAANRSGALIDEMIFDADTLPASCSEFAFFTKVNLRFFNIKAG